MVTLESVQFADTCSYMSVMYSHPFLSRLMTVFKDNSREEYENLVETLIAILKSRSCDLENHECMKVVMEKTAKLFPTYLMNPANRKTFHPQNFCHLQPT